MSKLGGGWEKWSTKFYSHRKSLTKYLRHNNESKHTWTGAEKIDNWFCVISRCAAKFFFLGKRLSTRLYLNPDLTFFEYLTIL